MNRHRRFSIEAKPFEVMLEEVLASNTPWKSGCLLVVVYVPRIGERMTFFRRSKMMGKSLLRVEGQIQGGTQVNIFVLASHNGRGWWQFWNILKELVIQAPYHDVVRVIVGFC